MAIFTDPVVNGWLATFRNVAPTIWSSLYLCLFTGEPPSDGTFALEVVGGSYARQLVTFSDPYATPRTITTTVAATYTNMPAVTVTWGGIASALTTGTLLAKGAASAPFDVNAGDPFIVNAGDFDLDIL